MGSYSTAARISNPACWNPRLKPPAPANKSITKGRDFMELASQPKWRVRIPASVNNLLPVEKTALAWFFKVCHEQAGEYNAKMINFGTWTRAANVSSESWLRFLQACTCGLLTICLEGRKEAHAQINWSLQAFNGLRRSWRRSTSDSPAVGVAPRLQEVPLMVTSPAKA